MNLCIYGEAYDCSEVGGIPYCLKVLPTAPGDEKTDDDGKSYFLVDKDGKSCFSNLEAERATARLEEIKFIEQIAASLNSVDFVLPQHKKNPKGAFCNEQVYSNLNLLIASGVVSLSLFGRMSVFMCVGGGRGIVGGTGD
ncbi:hypothetical protein TL16_g04742 [Triparma laevis f. inornata]|uniref:Uncharacterized protein n=2 Tax=Triparma laevis TaxID=1534972 RepID=A0A9W7AY75_9STRA|nr:hypothetical protein TL16_g04742 [Triparma laevis f. inornata]GMH80472.1 hypothetical protein TrLO_g15746 [Triparma laevis f. longispina]